MSVTGKISKITPTNYPMYSTVSKENTCIPTPTSPYFDSHNYINTMIATIHVIYPNLADSIEFNLLAYIYSLAYYQK